MSKLKINIISAVTPEYGIGSNGHLPWRSFKSDMKWFKQKTINKPIIMGRKTWESFNGKPLKNRFHCVVSSTVKSKFESSVKSVKYFKSLDNAIEFLKLEFGDEVFVIGGYRLFEEALQHPLFNEAFITEICNLPKVNMNCDVYFPQHLLPGRKKVISENVSGELITLDGEKTDIHYSIYKYTYTI